MGHETLTFTKPPNMRKFHFALGMCAMLSAGAQWDLFPLGQRSYYQDVALPDMQVDLVLMDSMRVDSTQGTWLYNRTTIREQIFGPCAWPVLQHMEQTYGGMGFAKRMDSLLVRNDTTFYFSGLSTEPFFFLPKAAPGQSWTVPSTNGGIPFSSILITCTGISQETFLGVTDSVKTFSMEAVGATSPINTVILRLSKGHGLLEYVAFDYLLYHPSWTPFRHFSLIGMENGGTAPGYHQPVFADYFHLSAGDVLLWRTIEVPASPVDPTTTTYQRDSLVTVLLTPDSVVYTYDGVKFYADSTTSTFQGYQVAFRRDHVQGLLGAAPNGHAMGFGTTGTPFPDPEELTTIWHSSLLQLFPDTNGTDTTTAFGFETWGSYLDTLCTVNEFWDWSYEWRINTRAGLIRHCENFSFGSRCTELIASSINGVEDGNINLGTDELVHVSAPSTAIYPNPASNLIFISGAGSTGRMPFSILDGLGREVLHGVYREEGVAVEELPAGLYVLRIIHPEGAKTLRFLKE